MATQEDTDPYAILGLTPEATAGEIRAQFRLLAKRFHPDLNAGDAGHQEQFRRVHAAYEFLLDTARKAENDTHYREAAGPISGGAPKPTADGLGSVWLHVGAGAPSGSQSTGATAATADHGCPRSAFQGRPCFADYVTWGLAACVLLLFGIMRAAVHEDASLPALATVSRPAPPGRLAAREAPIPWVAPPPDMEPPDALQHPTVDSPDTSAVDQYATTPEFAAISPEAVSPDARIAPVSPICTGAASYQTATVSDYAHP